MNQPTQDEIKAWTFCCDFCGHEQDCNERDLAWAIESAKAAGWQIGLDATMQPYRRLNADKCPKCMQFIDNNVPPKALNVRKDFV